MKWLKARHWILASMSNVWFIPIFTFANRVLDGDEHLCIYTTPFKLLYSYLASQSHRILLQNFRPGPQKVSDTGIDYLHWVHIIQFNILAVLIGQFHVQLVTFGLHLCRLGCVDRIWAGLPRVGGYLYEI